MIIDNSPSCWRSLRLRLVRGFLDHWESYDFTLTKIHCDVSHRCIARKFLLLLGAKLSQESAPIASQVPPLLSETLAVWRMVRLYQNQKPS